MTLQAAAQDMSAWSDKTVCRLAKQNTSQALISEVNTRALQCLGGKSESKPLKANINLKEVPQSARSALRDIVVPSNGVDFLDEAKLDEFITQFGRVAEPLDHMRGTEQECTDNISKFPISLFASTKNDDAVTYFIECRHATFNRYIKNPITKLKPIENILLYWAEHKTVKYPRPWDPENFHDDQDYASAMLMGDFTSFYAVFYDRFDFTAQQRFEVDSYIEDWMANQDLDPRPNGRRCDLNNPLGITRHNHNYDVDTCGSNRWRMAIGGVLLGLKAGNQRLFDAGVRHLEVALAMIGEDGIFIPWANKGPLSLSYTRQLPEVLSILGVALKSIGYDFYEHKTPQGKKIHEVYGAVFDAIYDPEILYKHSKNRPEYAGVFLQTFKALPLKEQWKHEYISPSVLAQASRDYILRFRLDLATDLNLNKNWRTNAWEHMYQFPGASGVMLLYADKKANPDSSAAAYTPSDFLSISSGSKKRIANLMADTMKVEVSLEDFLNNVTKIDEKTSKSDLYGSYRLDWFIINIGSSGGYVKGATDYVTINGDGMIFDKVDRSKFPTPDLRKKLVFTMIGDGNFTLKGPLGTFDLEGRSYPTTIFGNIHQKLGLGIWQEGDPILVRLTKQ
jgi:hypothetical protein